MTARLALVLALAAGCSARPLDGPLRDGFRPGFGPGGALGDGGTGDGGSAGSGGDGGSVGNPGAPPAAPRLVAPLSTATVSTHRPRLRWDMHGVVGPATVELCGDRACGRLLGVAVVEAGGDAGRPDFDLLPGVVFWRVRAGDQVSATWEFFVGKSSAPADGAWGNRLDVDGDGVPDLAAAAGSSVAVWRGGAKGLASAPTILPSPDGSGAGFGYVIASAGDLNGDGFSDLAVGECGTSYAFVHLFFGGAGGLGSVPAQTLQAPDAQTGFGCRVAAAGDLNGDGYADLAVARTGVDFTGGLYIFYGGPGGVITTTARIDSPNRTPSRLGYSLAAVGDVDGDGYDDLAATELDYSDLSGQVHLYRGGKGGIGNHAVIDLAGPDGQGVQFGGSVALAGDTDGDGRPDFIVAGQAVAGYLKNATTHLYFGGSGALGHGGSNVVISDDTHAGFAFEVAGGGDLDGDGYSDVLVSATDSIFVFHGSAGAGPIDDGDPLAGGQGRNPRHLALVGDTNGDGYDDVLVADGAGVELLLGGSGGLSRTGAVAVPLPSGAGQFGGAVE